MAYIIYSSCFSIEFKAYFLPWKQGSVFHFSSWNAIWFIKQRLSINLFCFSYLFFSLLILQWELLGNCWTTDKRRFYIWTEFYSIPCTVGAIPDNYTGQRGLEETSQGQCKCMYLYVVLVPLSFLVNNSNLHVWKQWHSYQSWCLLKPQHIGVFLIGNHCDY